MNGRLRQVLADCNVAAVTVAVLLFCAFDAFCRGLWDPLCKLGAFVITGIAIRGVPYMPSTPPISDRLMFLATLHFVYSGFICLLAASLLSRWVYGAGPIRSLSACRSELVRRNDA